MKRKFTLVIALTFIIQSIVLSQGCLPEGITFATQAEIDSFQTNYPNCTEIEGDVIISGTDITNLSSLNVLTSFGADVSIWNNDLLENLSGLENITSLGGNLEIGDHVQGGNPSMTSLSGLDNLVSVEGHFYIKLNYELENLEALNNLNSIGEHLSIVRCDGLINLVGLENLNSIGDYLEIYKNASLINLYGLESLSNIGSDIRILENPILVNLIGLENITSIDRKLWIYHNDSLTNLIGLNNITAINENIEIAGNNSLYDLSGLDNLNSINGDIYIVNNNSITSLSGLDNIETVNYIYIDNNSSLSICDVEGICNYISNPNSQIHIENNSDGCNSKEEVEEACDEAGVVDTYFESIISIYPNPAKNEIFISTIYGINVNEIIIYNPIGQKILYKKTKTNSLNISSLHPGIYVIELVTKDFKIKKKLVIEY